MRLRLLALPLAAAVLAAVVPSARAAYFPGQVIDSAPGLSAVEKADVAPDGTGAVTYLQNVGGVDHLFVVRLVNGGFLPPERVDAGVAEAASDAQVVAVDGGRLIVAWTAGGRLLVSARAASDAGWPAPLPVYDERARGQERVQRLLRREHLRRPLRRVHDHRAPVSADVRSARGRRAGGRRPRALDVNPAANAGEASQASGRRRNDEGTSFAVWGRRGRTVAVHLFGTARDPQRGGEHGSGDQRPVARTGGRRSAPKRGEGDGVRLELRLGRLPARRFADGSLRGPEPHDRAAARGV